MNKLKQADPDFYFEHIYENPDENHDMANTKSRFKPEEIIELKKAMIIGKMLGLKHGVIGFRSPRGNVVVSRLSICYEKPKSTCIYTSAAKR